ncbi:MAG TPA: carboxymuconolactone decarboxylase family protein [Alphaproteobacteria bacterium]|nr:carboxymuconolactone decarboxylase family protein [Alphaproteobacteria bacterium]
MPRIPRIDRSQATPEVAQTYDRIMKERGNIPNMFRTVAHRPEIMRTMAEHLFAVTNTGTVPVKLKELVIVRTTQINRCEY